MEILPAKPKSMSSMYEATELLHVSPNKLQALWDKLQDAYETQDSAFKNISVSCGATRLVVPKNKIAKGWHRKKLQLFVDSKFVTEELDKALFANYEMATTTPYFLVKDRETEKRQFNTNVKAKTKTDLDVDGAMAKHGFSRDYQFSIFTPAIELFERYEMAKLGMIDCPLPQLFGVPVDMEKIGYRRVAEKVGRKHNHICFCIDETLYAALLAAREKMMAARLRRVRASEKIATISKDEVTGYTSIKNITDKKMPGIQQPYLQAIIHEEFLPQLRAALEKGYKFTDEKQPYILVCDALLPLNLVTFVHDKNRKPQIAISNKAHKTLMQCPEIFTKNAWTKGEAFLKANIFRRYVKLLSKVDPSSSISRELVSDQIEDIGCRRLEYSKQLKAAMAEKGGMVYDQNDLPIPPFVYNNYKFPNNAACNLSLRSEGETSIHAKHVDYMINPRRALSATTLTRMASTKERDGVKYYHPLNLLNMFEQVAKKSGLPEAIFCNTALTVLDEIATSYDNEAPMPVGNKSVHRSYYADRHRPADPQLLYIDRNGLKAAAEATITKLALKHKQLRAMPLEMLQAASLAA